MPFMDMTSQKAIPKPTFVETLACFFCETMRVVVVISADFRGNLLFLRHYQAH